MIRLEIKNYNIIPKRDATKISALSSGKSDKYEYLTGEEILPSDQKKKRKKIEQAKFTSSTLAKKFRKNNKNNWG